MQIVCQAKGCTKSVEVPEKPASAMTAAFKKAGFTRLTTASATIAVCGDCRGQLAELALKIAELLQGQEVPFWQLIPEEQRGALSGEDLRRGRRT